MLICPFLNIFFLFRHTSQSYLAKYVQFVQCLFMAVKALVPLDIIVKLNRSYIDKISKQIL